MACVHDLDDDLLCDILSRASIVDLPTLRSVCKRWQTLCDGDQVCMSDGLTRQSYTTPVLRFLHRSVESSLCTCSRLVIAVYEGLLGNRTLRFCS